MIAVLSIVLIVVVFGVGLWKIGCFIYDEVVYRKARKEIVDYVRSYRRRCTGNNRFVVNESVLQDVFREYDSNTIFRVMVYMIDNHILDEDPMDGTICIRRSIE